MIFKLNFLLTFFLFLAVSLKTHAFVNIESLRQQIKSGWFGSTAVTLGGSTGNVNVFNTGVLSQNIYKKPHSEFIFINNYNYGEASGAKNTNNGHSHLRYAQDLVKSIKWEVFTQAEFNEFQSLTLRTLLGFGFRFKLFQDEETSFYLGLGTFYEDEDIKTDENQNNFRDNIYISYREVIRKDLEFAAIAYYQPSHKAISDYRIRLNLGLEFKLTEDLSWINDVQYLTDTRPPQGVKGEDFFFTVRLNAAY